METLGGNLPSYKPANAILQRRFLTELLSWHKDNCRHYPFRSESDPYRILVAEILLRQTRASQVSKIYPEFVREYPTIRDLAKTNANRLRSEIGSLGIRSRVADLLKIAKMIERHWGGRIPADPEVMLSLPGVGNYVANSVMVRAFGRRCPLVDVNVNRVLSRVFVGCNRTSQKDIEGVFMDLARFTEPSSLNYAIIDLAHSVCGHKNPKCPVCPLTSLCCYFEQTSQTQSKVEGFQPRRIRKPA